MGSSASPGGAQIIELMRLSKGGDEARLHFAENARNIPSPLVLQGKGVRSSLRCWSRNDGGHHLYQGQIQNLLAWIDSNPGEHHAMLDATSLLGSMPWGDDLVSGR